MTASNAVVSVTRTDANAAGWSSPLRVLYKTTGLRLVLASKGFLEFGLGADGVTKTLQVCPHEFAI